MGFFLLTRLGIQVMLRQHHTVFWRICCITVEHWLMSRQVCYSICWSVYSALTTVNTVSICDVIYEAFTHYVNITADLGGKKTVAFFYEMLCHYCHFKIMPANLFAHLERKQPPSAKYSAHLLQFTAFFSWQISTWTNVLYSISNRIFAYFVLILCLWNHLLCFKYLVWVY